MSDILFPTATTGVTPATGDIILIADVSDSNNPKDCTLAELPISTATQSALDAKASLSGGTFTGDISVPDEAYGVGWNGSVEVPTKNAVYDEIETKQDTLVSGTNIKTINSTSLLGSGDIVIAGVGDMLKSENLSGLANYTTARSNLGLGSAAVSATTDFAPALGVDDNYVTDAEKVVIGNQSGTNTGNQTITNSSDGTSHTVTLSATGGSIKLVEGTNITLTTSGTGADGIVTIASTGGGGGGSGDVVGPASATDNAIARFDTTTGKLIQNSPVTISDAGAISTPSSLTMLGTLIMTGAGAKVIYDENVNELLKFAASPVSPVNELQITNAATTTGPILAATGGDTNIDINLNTKGTGVVKINGSTQSGTNTGDQTSIVGITGTKAQFDTACTDGNFLYSGDSPTLGTITTTGNIELGNASDTTLSRVSAGVIAVEGVTVPTISSTDTLTNKRNQPRVVSATSYTTDTGTSLDVSTCDIFIVTAQAGALLFNAPSGTPVQGEKLIIRIKDNGTSRTLTYNAIYRAIGVTLPTATTISKTTYIGLVYNSTDTKWDCIAVSTEA